MLDGYIQNDWKGKRSDIGIKDLILTVADLLPFLNEFRGI